MKRLVPSILVLPILLAACGDDSTDTASDGGGPDSGGSPVMSGDCELVDDTGGPGQYADGCVKREWIADYAGTYTSDMCTLEINTSGSVPAVFKLEVKSGDLAGMYEHDWEGGTGPGNDSYYQFTTDTTFSTVATLSFSAGEKTSAGEASIGLRVENLETTPIYKATLQITITTPFENQLVECGELTH